MVKPTPYIREKIFFLYFKEKLSYRKINKHLLLVDNYPVSTNSICKIIRKYKFENRVTDKKRSGRKCILQKEHLDYIDMTIKADRQITVFDLKKNLFLSFGLSISISTIIRAAKKVKWIKKGTRYCQIVSEKNAIRRCLYASFCLYVNENFDNCIFLDECLIELNYFTATRWRLVGERNYKVGKPKHPLKLLLCAGISKRGAVPICIFTGIMNSHDFNVILYRNLIPFLQINFPYGHRLIMDNDRKHTSKETKAFLEKYGINHWKTPAQSPDLNPIELVWHELKSYCRKQRPKTKESLIQSINEFWSNILTPEKCCKYINHIPKVLPHVLLNNGYSTSF